MSPELKSDVAGPILRPPGSDAVPVLSPARKLSDSQDLDFARAAPAECEAAFFQSPVDSEIPQFNPSDQPTNLFCKVFAVFCFSCECCSCWPWSFCPTVNSASVPQRSHMLDGPITSFAPTASSFQAS